MGAGWITKPIVCNGARVSPGLDMRQPLLPELSEISYKIRLIMCSYEMLHCEGRQCSLDDIDQMESYDDRLKDKFINEDAVNKIVDDFSRSSFYIFLNTPERAQIEIDPRALNWTKRT
jgi:hypothetical protein